MSILALVITLAATLILAWMTAVYGAWRASEHKEGVPITAEVLTDQAEKVLRLVRRGWYSTERTAEQVVRWGGKKSADAVVKVFPKAAPVFAEKPDALTGLTHGPSSYFLKSISPEEKKSVRSKKSSSTVA